MTTSININTLSQKLIKQITAKGVKVVERKAVELIDKVHVLATDWKEVVRKYMSKPAISRGKTKGRLNPHNSWSMNQGFPMLVGGKLSKSARVRVSQRKHKNGIVISVKRWFAPTMNKGIDYGERLDEEHLTLMGWKERAYDILDARIKAIK